MKPDVQRFFFAINKTHDQWCFHWREIVRPQIRLIDGLTAVMQNADLCIKERNEQK